MYDSGGDLYAKYTYDVWGNPVSVTNANDVEITSPTDFANIQPLRYRSYYYDSDTGFYYLQSRYYDPVTHRFINADGLVSTGTGVLGHNMFTYCDNNPIMSFDNSGHRHKRITNRQKVASRKIYDSIVKSNAIKKLKKAISNVGKTIKAAFYSAYLNAGVGAGIRGSVTVDDITLTGGARTTLLSVVVDYKGISLGNEGVYGAGFGSASFDEYYFHPFNCDYYKEIGQHNYETCPNSTIHHNNEPTFSHELGFDVYCIVGANFAIGWDENTFMELIKEYGVIE